MPITNILLTPAEKAEELGVSKETLRRWRVEGRGPKWKKIGPQIVRYWPEIVLGDVTVGKVG